jgi:1,2-diacylglycerol 3-beta-glucosyltransferase
MLRTAAVVARAALLSIAGYLGVLTIAAVRAAGQDKGRANRENVPRHRFVVLIPAHDEERLIGSTLASLERLDYPADLVRVHVVADNCTDGTADIVRSSSAELHERHNVENPGKGPALQWLIAQLDARGDLGDAVVIVDADTAVDPSFITVVDQALVEGAQVVQGHYAVREGASDIIAFRAAAMASRTFLRPLGRTAIGGSAGLHGNGMAFRSTLIAGREWSDHLTEDVELHLELLLDGITVAFAPNARIEAEMPDSLQASRSQHERWERGRLELARRYVPTLVGRAVVGGPSGRVAYADAAMDQLVPPLSVVAAATGAWSAVAALRSVAGTPRTGDLVIAAATASTIVGHVLVALRLTGAPPSTYRGLLQTPRMVGWKLGLWLRVLLGRRSVAWTRTSRNR